MPLINLLLSGGSAEVEALLNLHGARSLTEYWATARRVSESALFHNSSWFESSPFLLSCSKTFAHGRSFANDAEFRRFCDAHPVRSFLRSHPARPLARLSDLVPGSKLRKTRFYREFMAGSNEAYAVVLEVGSPKHESFVGLHRREKEGDFSLSEMRVLEELQHQLAAALRKVRLLETERQARQSLASLFSQLPLATLVLDWDLEVLYCSPAALEMVAIWEAGNESARFLKRVSQFQLPSDILERCLVVKRQWVPPKRRPPVRRFTDAATFIRAGLPALRASICPMQIVGTAMGYPVLVVTFENLRPPKRTKATGHPRSWPEMAHLTPREREVALLVCDGNSDKEIAGRLGKSVATVKKQLGAIYQKLEVPSRSKLAALLRE